MKENFKDCYVLYMPKDVAGDFFWMETDDSIYFAAADCTGHEYRCYDIVICSNAFSKFLERIRSTKIVR